MASVVQRFENVYAATLAPRDPVPIVSGWNRLEGRPRTADFERSLRAEVRDPLWFLTRQWQYGEFQGEDAGSPIEASIALRTAMLDGYRVAEYAGAYDPAIPLEVRVEREPAPYDLMLHMQVSRCFARLLDAEGVGDRYPEFRSQLELTQDDVEGEESADASALLALGAAQLLNARTLIAKLRDGSYEALASNIAAGNAAWRTSLERTGARLLEWFERLYAEPTTEPAAWSPQRLAYTFASGAGGAGIALTASHYRGGHLDWYAFDAENAQSDIAPPPTEVQSFIPAAISFAGMPNPRYWEMESAQTEFGHIDVNTNDLAKLLLAEFMLMYSNDWCLIPVELPVGSLTQVDGLVVTDVFGEQMLVRAADDLTVPNREHWSMFRLSGGLQAPLRAGLLLTPALMKTVNAPPLEEVRFLRDEMANMVWAIEARVATQAGEGASGQLPDEQVQVAPEATSGVPRYVLGTSVPSHWRPFIPVHLPNSSRSIRLQRARMPNAAVGLRTRILRVPGEYYIDEEEIPRAGRIVARAFQRARWLEGKTFLWVGRRSATGRGEGSSGLAFDHLDERLKP